MLLKDSCGFCSIDHPAPQYFLYPSKILPYSLRHHDQFAHERKTISASFEE